MHFCGRDPRGIQRDPYRNPQFLRGSVAGSGGIRKKLKNRSARFVEARCIFEDGIREGSNGIHTEFHSFYDGICAGSTQDPRCFQGPFRRICAGAKQGGLEVGLGKDWPVISRTQLLKITPGLSQPGSLNVTSPCLWSPQACHNLICLACPRVC